MRWLPLAMVAWALGGCSGDCTKSADIQVMVVPNPDVVPAKISRLRVTTRVADAQGKSFDIALKTTLPMSGSAFVLRPDAPPATNYDLTVTVDAVDTKGEVTAIGSDHQTVSTQGCNRMVTHLTTLPFTTPGNDAGVVINDMGMIVAGPDMANCISGLPDEDADNRGDSCDICAADPEPQGPSDVDGDGLPDACDPDPGRGVNKMLYFEPFNTAGNWSTGNGITLNTQKGFLDIQVGAQSLSGTSDDNDSFPPGVRMQTWFMTHSTGQGGGVPNSDVTTAILLSNSPNALGQGTSGVECRAHYVPQRGESDRLEIFPVLNGNNGAMMTAPLPKNFPFDTMARLRLTQRVGGGYVCELATQNTDGSINTPISVSLVTDPPTGNQFMALLAANQDAHFYSIVAESALP